MVPEDCLQSDWKKADLSGHVAHGGGTEPGTGPKAGGGVKGRTEEDDLCLLIAALAADERFDIGLPMSFRRY